MRVRDALVPVDFSAASERTVDKALQFVEPDGQVCLLHVVDAHTVRDIADAGLGTPTEIGDRFRHRALERLNALLERPSVQEAKQRGIEVEPMVAAGVPFAEILRLSRDMDFAIIILAMRGDPSTGLEKLLFGSTAEKVMRGATVPVLCLPDRDTEGLS